MVPAKLTNFAGRGGPISDKDPPVGFPAVLDDEMPSRRFENKYHENRTLVSTHEATWRDPSQSKFSLMLQMNNV